MIIKGKSRSGPKQLAKHLLRTDTNGRVEVLELKSPAPDIAAAFQDWQVLSGGTMGKRGLYHANIDPDAKYTMTRDQWTAAVERLEQELGLDGQPRAVVLHEKNSRAHVHVVWQRTRIDSMTLVSDSHNYRAHERASLALEEEFGHDIVPGKHAKRDREKPPPKAEITHAEAQQAERKGLDPRELKIAISGLFDQSGNAEAFRAALAERGYLLAKGDRRDFVIVDTAGTVHSLSRQVKTVSAKELRTFMADLDRDALPSAQEAKARQRGEPEAAVAAAPERDQPAPETSSEPADAAKLRDTLETWHAEEIEKLQRLHQVETERLTETLDRDMSERWAALTAAHDAALLRYDRNTERGAFGKILDAALGFVAPAWAAERAAARREARDAFTATLEKAQAEEIARLERERDAELAHIAERHAQQLREMAFQNEPERRARDYDAARRLVARIEEQKKEEEERRRAQEFDTKGPEPPTSAR